jgi:tetratricopeptide (TPR) repeat protein
LRSRRCRKFRELGASNRAAGDWDGALRCFRTAARHARGAQIGLVAAELREAERETAIAKALGDARTLAGAGEWRRALAVLEAAPGGGSQTARVAAMRDALERRIALRDAWAAYAAGESGRARALVDRWRIAGDAEATALWRRAGAVEQAFGDAEQALRERAWERALTGWRTVLQIEPDDRVVWRRRALEDARVVAELRGDALAALERTAFHAARGFLDRADAIDPAAVAADLDRLRTRAQLLYNTALNLERTDPAAARPLYADVAAMTRPGESKHAAAQAALERLRK